MENLDLSIYTVQGLKEMANDAGIEGMAKAKRKALNEALSSVDLSSLNLDSYEKLKVKEPKADKKDNRRKVPVARRRSVNPKKYGRR